MGKDSQASVPRLRAYYSKRASQTAFAPRLPARCFINNSLPRPAHTGPPRPVPKVAARLVLRLGLWGPAPLGDADRRGRCSTILGELLSMEEKWVEVATGETGREMERAWFMYYLLLQLGTTHYNHATLLPAQLQLVPVCCVRSGPLSPRRQVRRVIGYLRNAFDP